jgi:hypothetical protein
MGGVEFKVACNVGRLVEARLFAPRTTNDVLLFGQEMFRTLTTVRVLSVICGDWRAATLASPEVADALLTLMRRGNGYFERSAVLLSRESATFNLQVERVFREAGSDARRAFRDPLAMRRWLGEVLTDAERRRMGEFLDGTPA